MNAPYADTTRKDKVASDYPEYRLTSRSGPASITLMVNRGDVEVGRVTLEKTQALPYLLSTDLYVAPNERGGNVVSALDAMKLAVVHSSGRLGLMCSVHSDNIPQLARLFKLGWRCVHYKNERHVFVLDV